MKPLLLAPLLLAISGCSNITIRTDYGEKYIVQNSTIEVERLTIKDIKYKLSGKPDLSFAKRCLENREKIVCRVFSIKDLEEYRNKGLRLQSEYQKYKPLLEKYSDNKYVLNRVTFKTIFQDINNRKRIDGERIVYCRSKNQELDEIAKIYLIKTKTYGEMDIRGNQYSKKICKRYYVF